MSTIKAKGYGTTIDGVEEFDAIRVSEQGDVGVFIDILRNGKVILKFSFQIDKEGFNQLIEQHKKGIK